MTDAALSTRVTAVRDERVVGSNAGVRYLLAAIAVFISALMLAPVVLSFFASIKSKYNATPLTISGSIFARRSTTSSVSPS